jgi:hypothetical protein
VSAASQTFTSLVQSLENRRTLLAQWQTATDSYWQQLGHALEPKLRELAGHRLALVHALDAMLERPGLTSAERRSTQRMLCGLAAGLLQTTDDGAVKAIYNLHSSTDFDAGQAETASRMKAALVEMMGVEPHTLQGDSPEALLNQAERQMAQADTARTKRLAGRRAARNARQQTPEQAARADQRKQAAEQTQQSLREVYRKLASALHPDRETDPVLRERKTALMAQVNQAYAKNDLLQLLGLQLELAHIDAASLAQLSQDRLRHYNTLLAAQLAEVERAIDRLQAPLRARFKPPPQQAWQPQDVLALMAQEVQAVQRELQQAAHDLTQLDSPVTFKAWIKAWQKDVRQHPLPDAGKFE